MVWITDILKTIKRIPNDGQRISESFSRLLDAQISSCKIKHIFHIYCLPVIGVYLLGICLCNLLCVLEVVSYYSFIGLFLFICYHASSGGKLENWLAGLDGKIENLQFICDANFHLYYLYLQSPGHLN